MKNKEHTCSGAWTGDMPCTGIYACVHCGKEMEQNLRRNSGAYDVIATRQQLSQLRLDVHRYTGKKEVEKTNLKLLKE